MRNQIEGSWFAVKTGLHFRRRHVYAVPGELQMRGRPPAFRPCVIGELCGHLDPVVVFGIDAMFTL